MTEPQLFCATKDLFVFTIEASQVESIVCDLCDERGLCMERNFDVACPYFKGNETNNSTVRVVGCLPMSNQLLILAKGESK